jgi:hypothetical protein
MVTRAVRIWAVVLLLLPLLLLGALVRTRSFVQRSTSAPDVITGHKVNADGSHGACASSSPDGSVSIDGCQKMNRTDAPRTTNALAMRSKGGGGEVAIITFLILFSLWCFCSWWIAGRVLPHRQSSARQKEV